jgi:hypothetical protein
LEGLVEAPPAPGSESLALLAGLGVPEELLEQISDLITADCDFRLLVRLFVALLAHSPAGAWLAPEQRAGLEDDVFGRRELRGARAAAGGS